MITKTEKEIYKEIENIWNKIVSIKDREKIIKGIESGKISLDDVKLSKDELTFKAWEGFDPDTTIPPDIAMKLKIYYGIPYDKNHELYFIFYDEETPSWASSLMFDNCGNIDYQLKCVIFPPKSLLKDSKKEALTEETYIKALETFLELSKQYGQEIFNNFCNQNLTSVE